MTDIYKQHAAAFSQVSAYAVVRDGQRVASISFKFPRDGAGRLYAYVHWLGTEMVRGYAGGYGYDKKSAAAANAAQKLFKTHSPVRALEPFGLFLAHLGQDNGQHWDNALRNAGFEVWQVI